MTENALNILKTAILLEKRGRAFYQKVAETATNPAVKEFFEMMAVEEAHHTKILADQFSSVKAEGKFSSGTYDAGSRSELVSKILSTDIMKKIESAGFESAAISGAISMEEKAERIYRERAENAADPEEKKLYEWLAKWEAEHLAVLAKMDRMLTEAIWNDNKFWPF